MKRYFRPEEKEISETEISKGINNFHPLTPEASLLQKIGVKGIMEMIEPQKGIYEIIQNYCRFLDLSYHRN